MNSFFGKIKKNPAQKDKTENTMKVTKISTYKTKKNIKIKTNSSLNKVTTFKIIDIT